MTLTGVAERWRFAAERWLDARIETVVKPRYPEVALEITATHVVAVSMTEPESVNTWPLAPGGMSFD